MGKFIPDDVCEQILVRLDVEDLIRWKCVCKSWQSLISHPRFVKAHHKRQVGLSPSRVGVIPNYLLKYGPEYYMVGSSNGLVCISSFDGDEIIVANPWTREVRMLQKLPVSTILRSCWGFGYDALITDDYKLVFGVAEGWDKTTFHVLSLKSNVWKHVGHVNYICFGEVQIGTLCNGELYWAMFSGNPKTYGLISFDLSKEVYVFTKFYPRDDSIRECSFLAIKERYVCIYCEKVSGTKKYNYKLYWEKTRFNYYTLTTDSEKPYTFIPTTVMPSLISPYLQEGNV